MSTKRSALGVCGLMALIGTVGCVMPDDVSRMQKDMADVQLQLTRIQRDQDEARRQIDELARIADRPATEAITRGDLADVTLRLDQVSRQVSVTGERMNDFNRRLDRYSQDLQQTREMTRRLGPSPTFDRPEADEDYRTDDGTPGGLAPRIEATPSPGSAIPDPEALYNTAYADFSKGNYALAISGFEEYQQRFAESALADNALYWVAECHFSQGDFEAAVESLDRMLALYPRSDKAAGADLKKALAYMERNQVGQAIVQLRYVVDRYPGTDEARIARDKLGSLGD